MNTRWLHRSKRGTTRKVKQIGAGIFNWSTSSSAPPPAISFSSEERSCDIYTEAIFPIEVKTVPNIFFYGRSASAKEDYCESDVIARTLSAVKLGDFVNKTSAYIGAIKWLEGKNSQCVNRIKPKNFFLPYWRKPGGFVRLHKVWKISPQLYRVVESRYANVCSEKKIVLLCLRFILLSYNNNQERKSCYAIHTLINDVTLLGLQIVNFGDVSAHAVAAILSGEKLDIFSRAFRWVSTYLMQQQC